MRIVSIGNAPSSGSTFLADLLDGVPYAACGPELHLLSPLSHYQDIADAPHPNFRRAACPACYAAYADRFGTWALADYGTNRRLVQAMLRRSPDFPAFVHEFAANYGSVRCKKLRIFFEKTPENVHAARYFLAAFPEGVFVHVVRSPHHVYRSLRRRGFGSYLAAATWLVDVAAAYALRDHPRALTIRYEDLVHDPEAVARSLLSDIGETPPDESILQRYRQNTYRAGTTRLKSWTYSGYGKVGNANRSLVGEEGSDLDSTMRPLAIAPAYAQRFNLPPISLKTLALHYGYDLEYPEPQPRRAPGRDVRSLRRLTLKWLKDASFGLAGPADLPVYLRPAIPAV